MAELAEELLGIDGTEFGYNNITLLKNTNVDNVTEKWKKPTSNDPIEFKLYARSFGTNPHRVGDSLLAEAAYVVYADARRSIDEDGNIVSTLSIDKLIDKIKIDGDTCSILKVNRHPNDAQVVLYEIYCKLGL